jgi:hypothetical protein
MDVSGDAAPMGADLPLEYGGSRAHRQCPARIRQAMARAPRDLAPGATSTAVA